jgi:alcohol dehydrogenase
MADGASDAPGIPEVMAGVQLTGHGGPEKLVWRGDIPVPRPGPGEVLVRVLAAGINNTDINTRIGWYAKQVTGGTAEAAGDAGVEAGGWGGALDFPRIQGADLCCEVAALGEGVKGLSPGMRVTCPTNQPEPTPENPVAFRVIGSEYDGAFAQFCCVPARHLHDVSVSPLDDVEVAAMPCAFGTAETLIDRAGVAGGERVLVTGASGGVGLAAVQLAAQRGARVAGVAGAAKHDAVRAAGAEAVLDRDAPLEAKSCDVAIDLVGGPRWGAVIEALRPGGRYATAGAIAGPIVEADLRTIYLNDLTLYGCTYQPPEVFTRLVALINTGKVRPLVSKTYPLREIAAAQADFIAKRYAGKLVLIPPEVS